MPAPTTALQPAQEQAILDALAAGESQVKLSRRFGVARSTIQRIHLKAQAQSAARAPAPETGITLLRIDQLRRSPLNPRKEFDDAALDQLADDIKTNGVLQNLVVRRIVTRIAADGTRHYVPDQFEIVAGERRARAIVRLHELKLWPDDGLVPCRIIEIDDKQHRVLALIENLQRVDLSPFEEATAFADLLATDANLSTAAIAQKINRSQRYVQQRLALLKLIPMARELLTTNRLSIEAARRLCSLSAEEQQTTLEDACDMDDFDVLTLTDIENLMPVTAHRREQAQERNPDAAPAPSEASTPPIDDQPAPEAEPEPISSRPDPTPRAPIEPFLTKPPAPQSSPFDQPLADERLEILANLFVAIRFNWAMRNLQFTRREMINGANSDYNADEWVAAIAKAHAQLTEKGFL
jgi:ParB family chromosome partitioning protein